MKIIIRWLISAIAIFFTAWLMPGISIEGTNAFIAVSVMAIVLGFANAIIRPILAFLSCGCIVATLGLFMLVINAITLWLSSWICVNWLNIGFIVDGFWSAFFGSIVISVVSFFLSLILIDESER
jgi:putative membrane protein